MLGLLNKRRLLVVGCNQTAGWDLQVTQMHLRIFRQKMRFDQLLHICGPTAKLLMIKPGSLAKRGLMLFANHLRFVGSPLGVFGSLRFRRPLKMKIASAATCDKASSESEAQC